MSLRAFHIIFIVSSILLLLGFGYWCLDSFFLEAESVMLWVGVLSFLGGVGLTIYLVWFFRKLKSLSIGFVPCLLASVYSNSSLACSVCYGNPNSTLTKSANMGTLFLLGVVAFVLLGFAFLFISWAKRIQKLDV